MFNKKYTNKQVIYKRKGNCMAKFITSENNGDNAVYFKKNFTIYDEVKSVYVNLTSIGVVKGYVNNKEFDNDVLTPGWVNFNKRIPVYQFDITNKVKIGTNELSFILGNGWGVGKIAWFGKGHYSKKPLLYCEITVTYLNGKKDSFGSDASFLCGKGPILDNDIFDGETHDNNKQTIYENQVEEVEGLTDRLENAIVPLTKIKQTLKGTLITKNHNCEIYDFGQNHSGFVNVDLSSVKGNELTFIFGEMLNDDGSVYTDNLRSAKCRDKLIAKDGEQNFSTLFTFHGYRYLQIEKNIDDKILSVISNVIYSDLTTDGEFTCSDKNVNRLFQNITWGQKSNFINIPTDCPQRDERLGWTGDCQVFCYTAMFNMDCKDFFSKYLQDVRDAQSENGMIDCVAPTVVSDFDNVKGAPAWGDVITILPYEYYCFYKDKNIIYDNLDSAKKWVDYCVNFSNDYVRGGCGYGDWLSIDDTTDKTVLATLYMAYSSLLVSKMCKIVGNNDEQKYLGIYNKIKQVFNDKFVDKNGVVFSDTQTCYLLAYKFGILTKNQIKDNLLRTLKRKNNHLSTGFVGVKYLLPTLCDLGEVDLAYELLTKTDYPSWCYSVINGATTIWERWNSYTIQNGFADRKMNSFNHYSLGSVGEWIFKYVLGILPTEDSFIIKPYFDFSKKITMAKGSYKGISVQWKLTDDNIIKLIVNSNQNYKIDLSNYSKIENKGSVYYIYK